MTTNSSSEEWNLACSSEEKEFSLNSTEEMLTSISNEVMDFAISSREKEVICKQSRRGDAYKQQH